MSQPGFFDVENRLQLLSEFGDPLEKLSKVIDFEAFRPVIEGSMLTTTIMFPPFRQHNATTR